MGLDLRIPIGLMFLVLGLLITGFGLFGDRAIYQRSLGVNVNLWWGLVMLLFGLAIAVFLCSALILVIRRRQIPLVGDFFVPVHELTCQTKSCSH